MKEVDFTLEEIKREESLKLRALKFATHAHNGQFRKQSDVPYITHPIRVARFLGTCNVNKYFIAAAYLHDVVEDTEYSFDDIEDLFGTEVRRLVELVSEDKTKTWEERKQSNIDKVKNMTLDEKKLIACDKLANISDINDEYQRLGYVNFDKFKRGREQQEWYYRNMYFNLVEGEDEDYFIFRVLKDNINEVFDRTMEDYKNEQIKEKTLKI